MQDVREPMSALLVVPWILHNALQITLLKTQLPRDGRADDWAQLPRVSGEDDVGRVIRHGLDRYHHLRLSRLSCLVDKYVTKMAPGHAHAVGN